MDKYLNKIICGDCLEVMKEMPDKSIDMILTDPPYSSGGTIKKKEDADFMFDFNNVDQRVWMLWVREWLKHFQRIMKDGAYLIIFIDWRQLPALTDCIQLEGFIWQGIGVWEKVKGGGQSYPRKGGIAQNSEFIVWATKGRLQPKEKYVWGVNKFEMKWKDKKHPTEKPVDLLKELLKLTEENDTILDPFAGSGTTGVACQNLNRNYILIEKEQEYIDIINNRLSHLQDMKKPQKREREWEDRFNKLCFVNKDGHCKYWRPEAFGYKETNREAPLDKFFPEEIKSFIRQVETEAKESILTETNISMLRQWLNEKPADRLVTNEDIKKFLIK